MRKSLRVLNLGAGVQSTAIYLMIMDGDLPPVDFAVFADVGDEPAAVYAHVEFLKSLNGPEIHTVTRGCLGDNLINGVNADGQRHISIPTHLAIDGVPTSMGRRQCTSEYKILPIERFLREQAGLEKGQRLTKGQTITQVFGLSWDEPRRVERVKANFHGRAGWQPEFPLFDDMMTREDCVRYLEKRLPEYTVARSACVFCPYKRDSEWISLRDTDPIGWQRAIEIDRAIRQETSVCTKGMNATQYLHKSCVPLEFVELKAEPPDRQAKFQWSQMDCEGMCGN
jgi:3'-phosphoadenosine 5'-phosphosulfate sulfotransferase (PAPS reductase)/FAD synthetase